jgi:hypothetical protein
MARLPNLENLENWTPSAAGRPFANSARIQERRLAFEPAPPSAPHVRRQSLARCDAPYQLVPQDCYARLLGFPTALPRYYLPLPMQVLVCDDKLLSSQSSLARLYMKTRDSSSSSCPSTSLFPSFRLWRQGSIHEALGVRSGAGRIAASRPLP